MSFEIEFYKSQGFKVLCCGYNYYWKITAFATSVPPNYLLKTE